MSSTVAVGGDFTVASTKFKVLAGSGNTEVAGTLKASGVTTLEDDVILNKATTLLTHTGTTGLKITSTQAAAYVEVEDIRFTALKMGVGLTDVITLATTGVHVTGTLQTTGLATLASASVTGALSSGAATLASATLNGDLTTSGDIAMSKTASAITHTAAAGATSGLTISSDNGFVEVESVRITGGASKSDIGYGATDIIALSATGVGVTGTLTSSGLATLASATVSGALSAGATTITGATGITGRRPSRRDWHHGRDDHHGGDAPSRVI